MPTTTLPSLASTVAARTVGLTKVYGSGLTTVTALDDVSVELQRHRLLEGLDVDNTDEERQRCTAAYYGLVSYLDDNIGRILDALEGAGMRDDTLIVYTTDHGDTVGSRGLWGKTVLYEESAGIPLIVAGPQVPAGQGSATPVSLVDGYPRSSRRRGVPSLPARPQHGTDRGRRQPVELRRLCSGHRDRRSCQRAGLPSLRRPPRCRPPPPRHDVNGRSRHRRPAHPGDPAGAVGRTRSRDGLVDHAPMTARW
jgi:hypothetical protein